MKKQNSRTYSINDRVIFSLDSEPLDQLFHAKYADRAEYLNDRGDTFYALSQKDFDRFIDEAFNAGHDTDELLQQFFINSKGEMIAIEMPDVNPAGEPDAWVDPAGGTHRHDDDPASDYAASGAKIPDELLTTKPRDWHEAHEIDATPYADYLGKLEVKELKPSSIPSDDFPFGEQSKPFIVDIMGNYFYVVPEGYNYARYVAKLKKFQPKAASGTKTTNMEVKKAYRVKGTNKILIVGSGGTSTTQTYSFEDSKDIPRGLEEISPEDAGIISGNPDFFTAASGVKTEWIALSKAEEVIKEYENQSNPDKFEMPVSEDLMESRISQKTKVSKLLVHNIIDRHNGGWTTLQIFDEISRKSNSTAASGAQPGKPRITFEYAKSIMRPNHSLTQQDVDDCNDAELKLMDDAAANLRPANMKNWDLVTKEMHKRIASTHNEKLPVMTPIWQAGLYYLKVNNLINEPSSGKKIKIVGYTKEGIRVVDFSVLLKPGEPVDIDFPTFTRYMDEKAISIDGYAYENDRDKALLQNEINGIIKAFELEEEARAKEAMEARAEAAETTAATQSADADKERTKFGDTIKGMEALAAGGNFTPLTFKEWMEERKESGAELPSVEYKNYLKLFAASNGIPNNYKGKKPMDIWEMWTKQQKEDFLLDHFPLDSDFQRRQIAVGQPWTHLESFVKNKIAEHVELGQYSGGGKPPTLQEKQKIMKLTAISAEQFQQIKNMPGAGLFQWAPGVGLYLRQVKEAAGGKSNLGDKYDGMGQKEKMQRMRTEDLIFEGASAKILRGSAKGKIGIVKKWSDKDNQVDIRLPSGRMQYLGHEDIEILVSPPAAGGYDNPAQQGMDAAVRDNAKARILKGKKEWLVEDEDGKRRIVASKNRPKKKRLYTTIDDEGAKKIIISKVIGKAPKK